MKCEHESLTADISSSFRHYCRDCGKVFELVPIEPKEPEGKPENVLGPSACCDRDPCKCGKEKYKSVMCRTGEHGQCVKCPCECHGEKFCGCDNPKWVPSQFMGQFCTNCKRYVNPANNHQPQKEERVACRWPEDFQAFVHEELKWRNALLAQLQQMVHGIDPGMQGVRLDELAELRERFL